MKLSNTKIDKYLQCPRSYKLHYIDYIRPDFIGSPLFFGSAIDEALNRILLNKKAVETFSSYEKDLFKHTVEEVFDKHMDSFKLNGENIDLKTSLKARYKPKDYVSTYLKDNDILCLKKFLEKHEYENTDPLSLRNEMMETNFEELDNTDRIFLNMGSWFSLKRKGYEMLSQYKTHLYPLIEEVIDIQKEVNLPELDEDGNKTGRFITGKIDFRAKLKGYDGIVTCDNKTSSSKYVKKAVERSQQLGIYIEYTGDELGAYFLICKNPSDIKIKTCLNCDTKYEGGKIKKCKECKEELELEIKTEIEAQFLIGKPDPVIMDESFNNFVEIGDKIEAGIFPVNMEHKCFLFGAKCPYFDYCRKGDMKGLVNLKEKWGK